MAFEISDIDPHEQMLVLELRKEFEPLVASRAARRATIDERRYLSKIAILSWKRALPSTS